MEFLKNWKYFHRYFAQKKMVASTYIPYYGNFQILFALDIKKQPIPSVTNKEEIAKLPKLKAKHCQINVFTPYWVL